MPRVNPPVRKNQPHAKNDALRAAAFHVLDSNLWEKSGAVSGVFMSLEPAFWGNL
jgi:hypothetical protein